MDSLLARLERRFGRYAIEGLVTYLAMATGAAAVLCYLRPAFAIGMMLIPPAVRHGEIWRLVSFAITPTRGISGPFDLALELLFGVVFMIWIGQAIEAHWGAFRLNLFVFSVWLITVAGAMVSGYGASNFFMISSLGLVAATLFPNQEIRVFGIVPVPFKWLGLIDFATMVLFASRGHLGDQIAFAAAVGMYLLFCGRALRTQTRGAPTDWTAVKRESARRSDRPAADTPKRACVVCGLTDADEGADLRVCTCKEVCGGKPTVYCLPHAKSHRVPAI
ncbi:MAG: hypothetical protein ACHREM_26505 [Polyangiales bacterium]